MTKSDIDRIRNSAGMMTIGDESEGVITAPIVVADKLFIVKEGAIYQIKMADEIDPDRTRADIPNIQQRVLGAGSQSRVVQATILTAAELFKKEYLASGINRDFVIQTSMSVCEELLHAEQLISIIRQEMIAAEEKLKSPTRGTLALPSIQDIKPRTKSFIQRIEHFLQLMFKVAQSVIGEVKNKFFEGLDALIRQRFPADNEFTSFSADLAKFAKLLKNCRNAIEHPKQGNIFIIEDYKLDKNMVAHRPSVQLIHQDTSFNAEDLMGFITSTLQKSLLVYEELLAFMASHHLLRREHFAPTVTFVEEDRRRLGVKFGIAVEFNGQLVPAG